MFDFITSVWGFIWAALTFPVEVWRGDCWTIGGGPFGLATTQCSGSTTRDKIAAVVLGLIIYLIALMILVLIGLLFQALINKVKHLRTRRHCQHCSAWTVEVSENRFQGDCTVGSPCCESCMEQHEEAEFAREVERQPKIGCPNGHGSMRKLILAGRIVVDECTRCEGVFLDKGELSKIEKHNYDSGHDDGYSSGRSSSQSTNMMLGIAIGSAIN